VHVRHQQSVDPARQPLRRDSPLFAVRSDLGRVLALRRELGHTHIRQGRTGRPDVCGIRQSVTGERPWSRRRPAAWAVPGHAKRP